MGMTHWTAVEYDAAKVLRTELGSRLQRVELPKTMLLQVVIELDDELYAALSKNPTWLQKIQSTAAAKARSAMGAVERKILDAETKAQRLDAKAAASLTRDLLAELENSAEQISDDMADACARVMADYQKGQKALARFRAKCSGKIALTAVLVTAGVLLSVGTAGALSPLGVVGAVKGGLGVSQELLKLSLKADQVATLIQGELAALKTVLNGNIAQASKARQLGQGAEEIGLNVLGKLLGVETPSLKNCESHIAIHKIDIARIEKASRKLSETLYAAMDEQAQQAARRTLPAAKVGKLARELERTEQAFDKLIKATTQINESVERAETRQAEFEQALRGMKEGLPRWLMWVDVATGLTIDLAAGIADAHSVIEGALGSVIVAEQAIGNELIDLA